MPLQISRNDITEIKAEAIVNPTDEFLSGSGGTDQLIHEKAGKGLEEALNEIAYLERGKAVITDSYDLDNCDYIIHTCGPVYIDGSHQEDEILASCYKECLKLAQANHISSLAFPLLASGTFGFPKGRALRIANDTISAFLQQQEMDVHLLVYDKEAFDTAGSLYKDIKDYLHKSLRKERRRESKAGNPYVLNNIIREEKIFADADYAVGAMPEFVPDESFSECLIRMIDEKGLYDPDVYKKANIDRKLFNHIKNDPLYRPKKETAVALAIGMELDIRETDTLLERAGYVLSRSSVFDLIIRYCIEHGIYNIFDINEILFEEDQKTLGC